MTAFIVIIVILILIGFFTSLNKDKKELAEVGVVDKFGIIVDTLNREIFNNGARIFKLDERSFNLLDTEFPNQIIHFNYSTGSLTIMWKFKYFQQEVVHEKVFDQVRNITPEQQQRIALLMAQEIILKAEEHKFNTLF